jgi:hypothetical protein
LDCSYLSGRITDYPAVWYSEKMAYDTISSYFGQILMEERLWPPVPRRRENPKWSGCAYTTVSVSAHHDNLWIRWLCFGLSWLCANTGSFPAFDFSPSMSHARRRWRWPSFGCTFHERIFTRESLQKLTLKDLRSGLHGWTDPSIWLFRALRS